MKTRIIYFTVAVSFLLLSSVSLHAQTSVRRSPSSTPVSQPQTSTVGPDSNLTDVAGEIALLNKSLETLTARLRDISDKIPAAGSNQREPVKDSQARLAANLDILSRAEQRAEMLRKQFVEVTEREIGYKNRILQLDEDMRQENIDRSVNPLNGTTRTPELREVRRRSLENERRGIETLLRQTSESRGKLEEDLRQADSMVSRLRQRVLPLIDREIEKINPVSN
jgi:hypothetical protein